MATPHISAEKGDFAGTVLMPGDPLRARWIAKTYLKDPKLVTDVRNIFGYTGSYRGGRVSVMASGMGMPSIGIYSYELFCFYEVKNIIRIGSAGAYSADLKLRDILLADAAYSESTYARVQSGDTACWQYPSEKLNGLIGQTAGELDLQLARGPIHSSDVFYHEEETEKAVERLRQEKGLVCVEMESFALFHNADVLGRQAACLLTISDSFPADEHLSAGERERAFGDMAVLALETAIRA